MKQILSYILADDDPIYLEFTHQQLSAIPNLNCIATCSNATDVVKLLPKKPDLLILDVEMPGLSGVELAKSIKELPVIIFISSHKGYAPEAFDVDAVDFLSKPVASSRLQRAIEKASALIQLKNTTMPEEGFKTNADESFFIKDKNAFIKINHGEVLYAESLGDFVNIFLASGEKKIALVSLKNLEQQLPRKNFIRISRSHLVSKQKITAVETSMVFLGKIQLPIGKTYSELVINAVVGNTAVKRFIK